MENNVLIDPGLFALTAPLGRVQVEDYYARIESWSAILGCGFLNYHVSPEHVEGLVRDGLYPSFPHLMQNSFGLPFDAVLRIVDSFLLNANFSKFLEYDASVQVECLSVVPVTYADEALAIDLTHRSELALVACNCFHSQYWVVAGRQSGIHRIEIRASKKFIDKDSRLDTETKDFETYAYGSFEDFYRNVPESILVEICELSGNLKLFVDRAVVRILSADVGLLSIDYNFCASFFETCLKGGLSSRDFSMITECCARVILGIEIGEIFRETKRQNSAARIHSNLSSIAYRVHVTERGPAYRLMYWRHSDGSISFANVGPKREEKILE